MAEKRPRVHWCSHFCVLWTSLEGKGHCDPFSPTKFSVHENELSKQTSQEALVRRKPSLWQSLTWFRSERQTLSMSQVRVYDPCFRDTGLGWKPRGGCSWILLATDLGHGLCWVKRCLSLPLPSYPHAEHSLRHSFRSLNPHVVSFSICPLLCMILVHRVTFPLSY